MSNEEERWHVRIAPGEVKVLTLEQIDDLYRLDLIDGDTLLRQDGTEQWLPLRVVAGLDDEEAAPPAVARNAPPPPPVRNAPPPPPPVVHNAPPPPVVRNAPPPPVVRNAPPPPVVRNAPPPPPVPLPPPAEPAPFAPSPSFVPPPVSARPPSPPAPSMPAPSLARPAVPVAVPVSFAPPLRPPRASRAEPLLIGGLALLGLLIALHRNGALAALFVSAGQGAAYDGLETTLGGPGFGTPRAVEALVAKTPERAR